MDKKLFKLKESIESREKIAALIAGFKGRIEDFVQAERDLHEAGYDVVTYEYPDSVLTDGSLDGPLELFDQISTHFNTIANSYETRLYTGVSMGGAFGINMQREYEGKTEPGIYAGTMGNLSWSIFNQPAFLPIKRAYQRNGFSEEDLKKAWAPLYEPADVSFVVALGTRDFFVHYKPTVQMFSAWEEANIRILDKKMGHTKIIKWFSQNIPELLKESQTLI